MEIVQDHRRTWRYDFNARKSGVLVFGETQREHSKNSRNRLFRLGHEKIVEKTNYDHVVVNISIISGDTIGINERLSKGKRTLNTLTGIDIHKCGLTMTTCNIIFWSVVVPVALYGCEIWLLTGEHIQLLETFQNYACKKIQRFHLRIPNTCSMHSLGSIRLERFI